MINENMSKHSIERFQQRGFKEEYVNFIKENGDTHFTKTGAIYMKVSKKKINFLIQSKKTCENLRKFLKANFDKLIKKVLVMSLDDFVITVMNLNRRMNYE